MKAKGKNELLKHLEGEGLGLASMVAAKCYDCMGFYPDGRQDCEVHHCPLYPRMPFNKNKKASRVGRVFTDEQKKEISNRFKKARREKNEKSN
jgi:hypothetical protein